MRGRWWVFLRTYGDNIGLELGLRIQEGIPPCVRGVVQEWAKLFPDDGIPPHTRGYSLCFIRLGPLGHVVPVHTGVFPKPRPSGTGSHPLSPCTREYSPERDHRGNPRIVVPVHAGVFRRRRVPCVRSRCCRHTCGGIPKVYKKVQMRGDQPPYARGYSSDPAPPFPHRDVVPVYTGVFPDRRPKARQRRCCPRERGGIPAVIRDISALVTAIPVHGDIPSSGNSFAHS